jgi:hypothetical protein
MTNPRPKKSDYTVNEDGGVVFTGDPDNYSETFAASLVEGLELGSQPAPTGDPKKVTKETAARTTPKSNPNIEMGAV